jgi:hypothetical protein
MTKGIYKLEGSHYNPHLHFSLDPPVSITIGFPQLPTMFRSVVGKALSPSTRSRPSSIRSAVPVAVVSTPSLHLKPHYIIDLPDTIP